MFWLGSKLTINESIINDLTHIGVINNRKLHDDEINETPTIAQKLLTQWWNHQAQNVYTMMTCTNTCSVTKALGFKKSPRLKAL